MAMSDDDYFLNHLLETSRLEVLEKELKETKLGLKRAEGFAAASFVLLLSLIRQLLARGDLDGGGASDLVREAVAVLRNMYNVEEAPPVQADSIDLDALLASADRLDREKPAEDLLLKILASLDLVPEEAESDIPTATFTEAGGEDQFDHDGIIDAEVEDENGGPDIYPDDRRF
jgi:hypothetical protein